MEIDSSDEDPGKKPESQEDAIDCSHEHPPSVLEKLVGEFDLAQEREPLRGLHVLSLPPVRQIVDRPRKGPSDAVGQCEERRVTADPSHDSADGAELWRGPIRTLSPLELREQAQDPRIPCDHFLEVERAKKGSAMEQFECERLVASGERLGLTPRPNHVDADNFSEPATSSKADRNEESECEGEGVRQVLCAVPDEDVKVDIVRRDVTAGCRGARKGDTVDERACP